MLLRSLPLFLLAPLPLAAAQQVQESLSFGRSPPLSRDGRTIPNWSISTTKDYTPKILSDRVILTPVHPGNRHGAVWATSPLTSPNWKVDMSFRVNGPQRGSGSLQIWLVKEKTSQIELASIYSVDIFDGLALVIDQYRASGGSVRGFLNDGTTHYKGHTTVDKLAFGHCHHSYRNLGRMSGLEITQNDLGFEVKVDGKSCFKGDKMRLPTGYFFGISASSADNPDSFEINKFEVTSLPTSSSTNTQQQQNQQAAPPPAQQQAIPNNPPAGQSPPQQSPFQQGTSGQPSGDMAQLLRNLEAASNNINNMYRELQSMDQRLQQRHDELKRSMPSVSMDQISSISRRVEQIEQTVQRIQHDIEGKEYQESLNALHEAVEEMHTYLGHNVKQGIKQIMASKPRLGFFVFIILAFQGMLAVSYIIYKRRRASGPKKLL